MRMDLDDRADRCGHIELTEPVIVNGAELSRVLVVPPALRRFVRLSAQEHRVKAKRRRAELARLAQTDEWPYGDPLEKLLAEEGLEDADALDSLGESFEEPPLNSAYRNLLNRANRLARLVELDAPVEIFSEERARVIETVAALESELRRASMPKALREALSLQDSGAP
jgi:hypothetical protein